MSIAMKFARILLILCFMMSFSTSCATFNVIRTKLNSADYIDSNLARYVTRFQDEALSRGYTLSTENLSALLTPTRSKEEPYTIGYCQINYGYPVVSIDPKYWETADEADKERLIFHELAHCLLGRDHCEVKENGLSVSLMEPDEGSISSDLYKSRRKGYVDELFVPHSGCSSFIEKFNRLNLPTRCIKH